MKNIPKQIILLLLALYVFSAGHGGIFILDDIPNLKTLERLSSPLTFEAISSVVFTNNAGVLGRIIPMASFVPQYQSWPYDAGAFRLVNIVIHLFNGLLVFFVTRRLLAIGLSASQDNHSQHTTTIQQLALCVTAIWLIHPLQVSTVLYIVQRSTELSATFTLLGLLLYLHGRTIALGSPLHGYAVMGLGIFGMTLLAMLCKENGVLLPLYILLLEFTLLNQQPAPQHHSLIMKVIFIPPIVAGLWFASSHFHSVVTQGYASRDFSLSERLLTETRVLLDYLRSFVLPALGRFGVFHDDFPLSHSLFDPASTFWATALLGGLFGAAIALRNRASLISFSILWFFVAHSLESTFIPLEIYFEHRNYLAILGPAILLCLAGRWLLLYPPARGLKHFFAGLALLWFCYISLITRYESSIWGQHQWAIAEAWSHDHPNSVRAQSFLAGTLATEGFNKKAASMYQRLAEGDKPSASAYLSWLVLGCMESPPPLPEISKVTGALRQARYSASILNGLEQFVVLKEDGACILADTDVLNLFEATLANQAFNGQRYSLFVLQGRMQSALHQTDAAVASYDNALKYKNDVEVALLQVKVLAGDGRYDEAMAKLGSATSINATNTLGKRGYARDIENWRVHILQSRRPQ